MNDVGVRQQRAAKLAGPPPARQSYGLRQSVAAGVPAKTPKAVAKKQGFGLEAPHAVDSFGVPQSSHAPARRVARVGGKSYPVDSMGVPQGEPSGFSVTGAAGALGSLVYHASPFPGAVHALERPSRFVGGDEAGTKHDIAQQTTALGILGRSFEPQTIRKAIAGKPVGLSDVGWDAALFLPGSRLLRGAGEAINAARLAEDAGAAGRTAEAVRAGSRSYKSGKGVVGGAASAAKRLLPSERALRASDARTQLFSHLDQTLDPAHAQAEKNLFDQSVKAIARNGNEKTVRAATERLAAIRTHSAVDEAVRNRALLQEGKDVAPRAEHLKPQPKAEPSAAAIRAGFDKPLEGGGPGVAFSEHTLAQGRGDNIKGALEVTPEDRAIIHLTQHADVTTPVHELGHFLRRYGLNPEQSAKIAEWLGATGGEYTRAQEEKFARGLEWMIRQGHAPNNLVQEFHVLEPAFRAAYPEAGRLPSVPEDIRAVYQQLLGHRDGAHALYYTLLKNPLIRRQITQEARHLGRARSPEEAQAHLAEKAAIAKAEGYGRILPKVPELKAGETSSETGGAIGAAVREGLVGTTSSRNAQEAERAVERSARARAMAHEVANQTGLERHIAVRSKLKGELPHGNFEGFQGPVKDQVDQVLNHIYEHPHLRLHEKANAADAILNGIQGQIPRKFEQKLLERAFGKMKADSTLAAIRQRGIGDAIANLANVPRALMASGDLSAPFRQGLVVLAADPKLFFEGFGPMLRSARSEETFQAEIHAIHSMSTFPLMEKAGLQLTDIGETAKQGAEAISKREEQFATNLAEKIPGVGRIVRGSDRAYVLFLNHARARLFNALVAQASEEGWHLSDKLLEDVGKFVNSATGRGSLGKLGDHTATLNALFFSPRLLASRLNFLNPFWYMKMEPFARHQALRAALRLTGTLSTVLFFAKMAGAEVNLDPRNADFGKVRIGDMRLDVAGGFQQPIRLLAQLYTGQIVSSTTGRLEQLQGGFAGRSRLDVALQFGRNKLAPVPSMISDWLAGGGIGQQGFQAGPEAAGHMIPLLWQDLWQISHPKSFSHPLDFTGNPADLAAAPADLFGVGVQSYGNQTTSPHKILSKLDKQSEQAGLGAPPASVQADARWAAELDSATWNGMPPLDRAKAAATIFDQRYGTDIANSVIPKIQTTGQAEHLYSELYSRLFPTLRAWQSRVDSILARQKAETTVQQPQSAAAPVQPAVAPAKAPKVEETAYRVPTPPQAVRTAPTPSQATAVPKPGPEPASTTIIRGGSSLSTDLANQILHELASGNFDPSRALREALYSFSQQPISHSLTVKSPSGPVTVGFQVPKISGPVGRAARGAIALAQHYLGTPYVWGGESPGGFDCSGLLQYIYAKQGISIPRTTYDQYKVGSSVPRSRLRPGDAVFFAGSDGSMSSPGHVGIYIGGGKFIEAPHTGATVRISNLAGYPGYVGARRYSKQGSKSA